MNKQDSNMGGEPFRIGSLSPRNATDRSLEERLNAILSAVASPLRAATFLSLTNEYAIPAVVRERLSVQTKIPHDELATRSTIRSHLEQLSRLGFAEAEDTPYLSVRGDLRKARGYRISDEGKKRVVVAHAALIAAAQLHKRYGLALQTILGKPSAKEQHSPLSTLNMLEATHSWHGKYAELAKSIGVPERAVRERMHYLQSLGLVETSSARSQGNWYRLLPEYEEEAQNLLSTTGEHTVLSALKGHTTDITLLQSAGVSESTAYKTLGKLMDAGYVRAQFPIGQPSMAHHRGGATILLALLRAAKHNVNGIPLHFEATENDQYIAVKAALTSTYSQKETEEDKEAILALFMQTTKPLSAETVRDQLGLAYSTAHQRLQRLRQDGVLTQNPITKQYCLELGKNGATARI